MDCKAQWLENAYNHTHFVSAGDFGPQSTSNWSSFWCTTRVH